MNFLGKEIGPYKDPFIVAEISGNHGGDINNAYKLIEEAKKAGADAVKIQAYTPDEMTLNCDKDDFICKDGPWKGKTLYELYTANQTPLEWIPLLFEHAAKINISIFSSVFGEQSLETLERVNCPAYKIASFEANYSGLIQNVLHYKKPVLISYGCANNDDIWEHYDKGIIPMHCVSKYPLNYEECSLLRIPYMRTEFNVVGYSDHSDNDWAAVQALTLGASIIEKHLKINNGADDADFSYYPDDFAVYVRICREAVTSLRVTMKSSNQYKRSIYVVKTIPKGELIRASSVKIIRPGYGLEPHWLNKVVGKTAKIDLIPGTALKLNHIEGL